MSVANSCGLEITTAHIKVLVFALVNIVLDESSTVIPNTSFMYVRALSGAS